MATAVAKGALFPEVLLNEFVNGVKGRSALATLSNQRPLLFNGNREFVFTLDKEADLVAENAAKTVGGATITPITVVPYKFEYGTRVSDEFMYASEEAKLETLKVFAEGMQRKFARALDIAAMHGLNPRTATAATAVIGTNHFDSKVTQTVTQATSTDADAEIEAAIALVEAAEHEVTGAAIAPAFRGELAALKANGIRLYPDLAWGRNPGEINGVIIDVNSTVSFNSSKDRVIVGNFQDYFRWGIAKEIPLEVIEYGNPDNDSTLGDLKGHNQVYLRAEVYMGWAILDASAFALVKAE